MEKKGEKLQEQLFYHLRTEEGLHISLYPSSGSVFRAEYSIALATMGGKK
jgi:hypothetical protein